MARTHVYQSHLVWSGSTGTGIGSYDRQHRIVARPARLLRALRTYASRH